MVQSDFFTTTYSLIYFISLAVFCWLLIWSLKIKKNPALFPFKVLLILFIIWAVDYSFFSFAQKIEEWIFLEQIAYLSYSLTPVFYFILAWQYTDQKDFFKNRWAILPFIIPAITISFAWIPQLQHFLMYDFYINTQGPMPSLDYQYGIWGYIHLINGVVFTVGALLLLIKTLYFHPQRHQKGNICLIIGIFIFLFWNLIYITGFIPPWAFNLPVPFLLISLFFALAIFRYHSLDFLPMARNLVLEQMNNPFVIFSPDGKIIDMNPSLARVFNIELKDSIGMDFKSVFSKWPDIVSITAIINCESKKDQVFSLEKGDKRESYSIKRSVISDIDTEILGTVLTFYDISELESTRIQLTESNEELKQRTVEIQYQSRFLQILIDTLPIPIFYKDIKGIYTGCNTEFERYFGKSRDQIIGKSVYDLWPNEMAEKYYQADLQVFQSPAPQIYEAKVQYPDGSAHDVIFYKAPILTESNSVDGLIGTFLDITERKRYEEALKESESFNRGLVENLPDYIAVYGFDKKILYVNPALTAALGYQLDEIVNMPLLSFFAEEFRKTGEERISSRIQGNVPPLYEADILCRDNNRRSVLIKGTQIQYRHLPAILLLMNDITQRKQMEQALRENEEKFISIFEKTPDPVLILNSSYHILEINRGFEKYFEYSHSEVQGKHVDDLGIRLQQEAIAGFLKKSEHDYQASHMEMELFKKTGGLFIAEVTISRIIINTESCFIIQIHDIDEIHKAYEAISQVNHKLKILSSITRHDILNRIMVTSSYSHMLLEDAKDPDLFRKLNAIRQSSEEIQNLIEFTGQYQNLGETTPTWQMVEHLFRSRSIQGLLSGINLILDLKDIEIYADNMLEKVIYNLVENSVRHGKNLTQISLSSLEESGNMVIWYEDDGGGIIPEEKEKAFEKGFGKNTGLGLFLIREILSITGISIIENGISGEGVRFEMLVPAGKWRKISPNKI